ncbi:MAG: hypothetical protein IKY94_00610 [Lachnospiraceae bacterium]|nr:hypothetical protein [Lachnospiraceae bacterium]
MRITTKVIQNNSLTNINTNKLLQDKLSQQMSTEKKVNRPSDDPIVAIRALRLRTNVNQVTQYYEKNVPDAESWLEVTESALSSMSEVITDMIAQCTKGSNEDLTTGDRETILTALKALRDEVYSTGNADYAGRFIFTGYRTDTPLTFGKAIEQEYTITEQVDKGLIDSITYVDSGELLDINESNYMEDGLKNDGSGAADDTEKKHALVKEQDVSRKQVYRMRLSYNNVAGNVDANNNATFRIQNYDGSLFEMKDANGNVIGPDYRTASVYEEPYKNVGDDEVVLVKETGELLLGENVYNELMKKTDISTTTANEGEIRLCYKKDKWEENDLKPEHYFACSTEVDNKTINYNQDYLRGISDEEKQTIEYDVGLNQTIRVNTTADEVFTHNISRDVEDMVKAMEDTVAMQKQVEKFKKMIEDDPHNEDVGIWENQLAAMEKAFTFLNEKTQQMFENGITKMQKHLDAVNFAVTENGTRGQKLELISNRLMSQKTNFETLRSENEDIDITEVAIKLSSAELTYSSALMATGKVLQNNLMNFI